MSKLFGLKFREKTERFISVKTNHCFQILPEQRFQTTYFLILASKGLFYLVM